MSPSFKMHRWNTPEGDPEIITFADNSDCHYLHREGESVAAISMCQDQIIVLFNYIKLIVNYN